MPDAIEPVGSLLIDEATRRANAIFKHKSGQRSDAWTSGGLASVVYSIDKFHARLKAIVVKRDFGQPFTAEEVKDLEDAFLDITNYARMGYALTMDGHWFMDQERHQLMANLRIIEEVRNDERAG